MKENGNLTRFEKNPITMVSLSDSSLTRDEETIETYSELLDAVDFDRVLAVCKFACIDVKNEDCDKNDFFSRWRDESFWKDLSPGEAVNRSAIDRSALREVLSRQLDSVFEQSKIRINSINSSELYYSKNEEIYILEDFSIDTFKKFCLYIFKDYLRISEASTIESVMKMRVIRSADNSVIQLRDCRIESGKVVKGVTSKRASHMIKRYGYQAVITGKPTVYSKPVDMLLDHLSNFDKETRNRFEDLIATVFFNDAGLKASKGGAIRLFGVSGENGKSLFIKLLSNAIGGKPNVVSFKIKDLSDQRTSFAAAYSMLMVDPDSSSEKISAASSSRFKEYVTADDVDIRPLYGEIQTITPLTLVLVASNNLPKSEDKTDKGYLRRWNIIEVKAKLHESYPDLTNEWFEELLSDKSAQYLFEIALIRSQDLLTRELSPKSQHMLENDLKHVEENNSARLYIEDRTVERIVGFTVKEIKEDYEAFCERNDLNVLKKHFKETLENMFEVYPKTVKITRLSESSESFPMLQSGQISTIRAYQHKDEEENSRILAAQKRGEV